MSMYTCYQCGADAANAPGAPAHAVDLVGTLCKGCWDARERRKQITENYKRAIDQRVCHCGAPAKNASETHPHGICDACALRAWREDFNAVRDALLAIAGALGDVTDGIPTWIELGEMCVERIEALKARKPTLEEAQAVIVAEIERATQPNPPLYCVEALDYVHRKGISAMAGSHMTITDARVVECAVGESGPGLAAKHPDATPAVPLQAEHIVTVDDGRWDE